LILKLKCFAQFYCVCDGESVKLFFVKLSTLCIIDRMSAKTDDNATIFKPPSLGNVPGSEKLNCLFLFFEYSFKFLLVLNKLTIEIKVLLLKVPKIFFNKSLQRPCKSLKFYFLAANKKQINVWSWQSLLQGSFIVPTQPKVQQFRVNFHVGAISAI